MSWIKTQFNRFKKWLVLLIIPVAVASTIVLPVEATDYIHTEKGKIYIQNTDENENETFIIKSDKERYSGSGNFDVYISVENLNKKEWGTIQLKYNKGETINSISKYIPVQKVVDIPIYSDVEVECASSTVCYETIQTGTSTKEITVDTWEEIALTQLTEKSNVLKKEFKGKYDENEARFLFPKGVTFLKINISFPTFLTFRDEFIIEIFGENGGYGVLDPLIDNIIAYYKFQGNSDDETNTYDGTDTDISYADAYGKIDNGATFNGGTSRIALGNAAGLTVADGSFSFWLVDKGTNSNYRYIYGRGRDANEWQAIGVAYTSGGGLVLSAESVPLDLIPWATLTNGDHIVITFVSSTKKVNVYRNGSLYGSELTHTKVFNTNSTYASAIGKAAAYDNYSFDGDLDEFGYWGRVLTSAEVTELYNSGDGFQYPFSTDVYQSTGANWFE